MKLLVAEYAVATGAREFLSEGRAMLSVLVGSFQRCGHEVIYPLSDDSLKLDCGRAVCSSSDIEKDIGNLAGICDAGLVIAPDEILSGLTEAVEQNTINLGCSPDCIRLCADKLETTEKLAEKGIPVPLTLPGGSEMSGKRYVIKPRFGCGSEGIFITDGETVTVDGGFIATEYIEGEHLSASLIIDHQRKKVLPLTVNMQLIDIGKNITYLGCEVPYHTSRWDEIMTVASDAVDILGCSGYAGVDIVLSDRPYVVDVNPRPTTSIVGISKVIDRELGDLILGAYFGGLPSQVKITGSFTFTKNGL